MSGIFNEISKNDANNSLKTKLYLTDSSGKNTLLSKKEKKKKEIEFLADLNVVISSGYYSRRLKAVMSIFVTN